LIDANGQAFLAEIAPSFPGFERNNTSQSSSELLKSVGGMAIVGAKDFEVIALY
jgi:hypothetical protein